MSEVKVINVRMPASLWSEIKKLADEDHRSVNNIVIKWLKERVLEEV